MVRQRIATLALAGTVAFGAVTVHTPNATAEPAQPPEAGATQLSSDFNLVSFANSLIKLPLLMLGLSSIACGSSVPDEYRCEGLLPYVCLPKNR